MADICEGCGGPRPGNKNGRGRPRRFCDLCRKERMRAYQRDRERSPERRAWRKRYYQDNKETFRERSADWARRNRDRMREYDRRYRERKARIGDTHSEKEDAAMYDVEWKSMDAAARRAQATHRLITSWSPERGAASIWDVSVKYRRKTRKGEVEALDWEGRIVFAPHMSQYEAYRVVKWGGVPQVTLVGACRSFAEAYALAADDPSWLMRRGSEEDVDAPEDDTERSETLYKKVSFTPNAGTVWTDPDNDEHS